MKHSPAACWTAALLVVGLVVSGCQKPAADTGAETPTPGPAVEAPLEPAPAGQSEGPAETEPAPEPASEEEVTLQVLDWEQTRALVSQHRGKVVVMDLWATFCPPCVAEFPHLVEIHNELRDKVACISVSLDYEGFEDTPVDTYKEDVLAFLKKKNATMTNILCSTDSETLFSTKIEHKSMPVVYVFDREGNLAGQFPDPKDPKEFTYAEQVRPLVEQLLAGASDSTAAAPSTATPNLLGD